MDCIRSLQKGGAFLAQVFKDSLAVFLGHYSIGQELLACFER